MRLMEILDERGRWLGFTATTEKPNGDVDNIVVPSYLSQRDMLQRRGEFLGIVGPLEQTAQELHIKSGTDDYKQFVQYFNEARYGMRRTPDMSLWYARTCMIGLMVQQKRAPALLTDTQTLKQRYLFEATQRRK